MSYVASSRRLRLERVLDAASDDNTAPGAVRHDVRGLEPPARSGGQRRRPA